jgi:hypothetical protein
MHPMTPTVPVRSGVHILVDLDDIALGVAEEDLVPAVHRPLAVVGTGDVLRFEPLPDRGDIVGPAVSPRLTK